MKLAKVTKYPGWRTMNASQRQNAKYARIWEEYRRLEAERARKLEGKEIGK